MAAAASASMAATAALIHRVPATRNCAVFCLMPQRPSLSSTPLKLLKDCRRSSELLIKASSSDESPVDANELITDLKEKWDAVENKSTVLVYGGGAIVAVWLGFSVVGALDSVLLLPKILELVGFGYTGWFVYRYLLFESSRKELASEIEALKEKIIAETK